MTDREADQKATLQRYLRSGFDALRWKLEGLSEYDLRRPLVPTGTNLLGIAKHVALVSSEYFGRVFDRATAVPPPSSDEINADLWATADESAEAVLELLATAAAEATDTVAVLELDAPGRVPWWPPERADVTLHQVVVHMLTELNRHAGHADIIRELVDGQAGLHRGNDNLPGDDDGVTAQWWSEYRARLQAVAESFR